jgi:hypothetical protein
MGIANFLFLLVFGVLAVLWCFGGALAEWVIFEIFFWMGFVYPITVMLGFWWC